MPKTNLQMVVIASLLATHLIADFVLCVNTSGSSEIVAIIGLALPLSQGSLLALWACMAGWRSYVRFPLACFGITWTWFVAIKFIPIGQDRDMAASYALFFVVQTGVIITIYYLLQIILRWIAQRRNPDAVGSPPLQFSIGFLLIWTAVIALFLGLGKTLCLQMDWRLDVIHGEYFYFGCVIGTYDAFYALVALAAALARKKLLLRIALAAIAIGLVASSQRLVLEFVFKNNGGVHWAEWILFAGSQAAFLFATLLPLRWCGLLKGTGKEEPIPDIMEKGLDASQRY